VKKDIGPLWARIRRDDGEAWGELVREYAGLVYTVARRAGLGTADAEDCAQHTWLALYRRRRSIRDPQAIPAWLIRTARRQALRLARRLGREVDLALAPPSIDREPGYDEALAKAEFQTAVKKAVGQLDPRCRELILYLFGSPKTPSYREIAASLGVQPNTLGPLRARCLERLKEILKKSGWELN